MNPFCDLSECYWRWVDHFKDIVRYIHDYNPNDSDSGPVTFWRQLSAHLIDVGPNEKKNLQKTDKLIWEDEEEE